MASEVFGSRCQRSRSHGQHIDVRLQAIYDIGELDKNDVNAQTDRKSEIANDAHSSVLRLNVSDLISYKIQTQKCTLTD